MPQLELGRSRGIRGNFFTGDRQNRSALPQTEFAAQFAIHDSKARQVAAEIDAAHLDYEIELTQWDLEQQERELFPTQLQTTCQRRINSIEQS